MEIIALANQKGGVAKTTTTYNLATAKAMSGKMVLMIDLDPQSSLTILTGIMPGKSKYDVCNLFNSKDNFMKSALKVSNTGLDNLYIIPSDINLAEMEQTIIGRTAREKILKKSLSCFEEYFDYIFIDCPPQLGVLTTNALASADKVIITTKAEYLSYRGIRALKNTIQTIQEEFNPKLQMTGFIITMFEKNINDQRDLAELFAREGTILGTVKKSADTYRSVLDGTPVVISNPRSDVAVSYLAIAKQL